LIDSSTDLVRKTPTSPPEFRELRHRQVHTLVPGERGGKAAAGPADSSSR
jgi:hypothetical protein